MTAPPGVPPAGSTAAAGSGRTGSRGNRGAPTDTVLKFDNLKRLLITGRSAVERDALLYLGGGQVSVVTAGLPDTPFQYGDLVSVTYVKARDPKWDESVQPAPPANLDVPGGVFRSAKHWLVMQGRTGYIVLRLEDANWKSVVDTIEVRTGRKVIQSVR